MSSATSSITAITNSRTGQVRTSERSFVVLFAFSLCIMSSIPFGLGRRLSFPESQFTGIWGFESDTNNYLAYAHQAASGSWLFHNPMTSEPHRNVFFNSEWLAMGKIAALLGISVADAMYLQDLFSILLMCIAVYWLSAYLLASIFMRRLTLAAVMIGGGFGWLASLHLLHIPINSSYFFDLTTGLFPFFWALRVPHFLVAQTFVVLGLAFVMRARQSARIRDYLFAGLCYLIAGSCRPYDMLYLMSGTSLYLGISALRNKELRRVALLRAIIPILMCIPLLAYYFLVFKLHPVFRWWSLPGHKLPAPLVLATSFGMAPVFLVFALWRFRGQRISEAGTLMISCLFAATILVYSYPIFHFSFQFATDIAVPLIMLGMMGLEDPIAEWRRKSRWANLCIMVLLLMNSLTAVALTGQAVRLVMRGDFRTDTRMLEAFDWLNKHSQSGEVVLADFLTSNRMPQYTHNTAFCGYSNTVKFSEKQRMVDLFLDPATSNEVRRDITQQNGIHYVLLTADEDHQLLETVREAPFLQEVFRNGAAVVYTVTTVAAPAPYARRIGAHWR
jgi:hypothetical protein